jgi:predicted nucleotidyltransferase
MCVVYNDYMFDFRSKTRQRLLTYFFTNPSARVHLRDLAQRLSVDPSNLSRDLHRLERERLFTSEMSGRQRYYQLNRDYPLYKEMRNIVTKTVGVAPLLAKALRGVGGIEQASLYGSFARNQQDAASDIDVLIVGEPDQGKLNEAIHRLERQLGREINYTLLASEEFTARLARKDAFLTNVCQNRRVSLIEHEENEGASRRLAANRPISRELGMKTRGRRKNIGA